MQSDVKRWSRISCAVASFMIVQSIWMRVTGSVPSYDIPGIPIAISIGVALLILAILGHFISKRNGNLIRMAAEGLPNLYLQRPYLRLLIISFVVLFVEVALIRYCTSQIRIFSFYKNIPLIGSFLGLGVGCYLSAGRPKHALLFLLFLTPLLAFVSQGSLLLGKGMGLLAVVGSSEHILGDATITQETSFLVSTLSSAVMGVFCVVFFGAIITIFIYLGRLMGSAFEQVERIPGYTVNIIGSLLGVIGFMVVSYLQLPPWVWFFVGLLPLFAWMTSRDQFFLAFVLIGVNALLVFPSHGNTVWSPYQKLVGHQIQVSNREGVNVPGYLVQISDVFYQVAVDLRPEAVAKFEKNPYGHYDRAFENLRNVDRVLIVGAGTGNDVAAALRAGIKKVDAVDIDPAIIEMGRSYHPEHPYDDPRVNIIIEDARAAFRALSKEKYDAVVFGLLDSHSQLGISSVRLDNYVFTIESLVSARKLLKPGGRLIITAATLRKWFETRLFEMVQSVCDQPISTNKYEAWTLYECQIKDPNATLSHSSETLSTDDWPFPYMPKKSIPLSYAIVLIMLVAFSVRKLKKQGMTRAFFTPYHLHLFFMGGAFLLMEVFAINRLALLYGTTWIVSAVSIAFVLMLIVSANLTVSFVIIESYTKMYALLIISAAMSYMIEPETILGKGILLSLVYTGLCLSPVYFAGIIFANSFKQSQNASSAIGANILGSVLGGWSEYLVMLVGIRSLLLIAVLFYILSCIAWYFQKGRPESGQAPPSSGENQEALAPLA